MTETPGAALEREHREIDEGLDRFAAGLVDGEWRGDALGGAARALRRHIYLEEELLFPRLREVGLIGPVTVMLLEHAEIWRALDDIEACGAAEDGGDARPAYHRLTGLLREHNEKEERILYPAADGVLTEDESARLHEFLASGLLPDGWVCERLRA